MTKLQEELDKELPMPITIEIETHSNVLDGNYILLLTSNSVERLAVNKILTNLCDADLRRDTRGCNLGFLGRQFALHVTGESGISKPLSIGRIAGSLLTDRQFPKPALVLLVGFCWGNPRKAPVGAVILSSHIVSLNEIHETSNGVERAPRHFQSTLELTSALIDSLGVALAPNEVKVIAGPMGSTETLYQNAASRNLLTSQFPDLLGGEMEAFGLLPINVPWLVVKAVSDLGDGDFNRDMQPIAARTAAETVRQLVTELSREGNTFGRNPDANVSLLEDLMTGDALKLDVRDLAANELNDVLNNRIGRPLQYKLCRYVSVMEYDPEFPSLMCAVLLELMQDAIKHGRANQAIVTLHPTKILIEDDGEGFDPRTLTGLRGGARDWHIARERYFDNGAVQFTATQPSNREGNRYVFALPKTTSVLREIKQKCSMQIAPDTIGAQYGSEAVLTFDETCQTLYFYAGELRMTSRRISVAKAIRSAMESGHKVYVGCPSERDMVFFKEELKDIIGDNLVVFVDAARPY